jgi:hypothetical protein
VKHTPLMIGTEEASSLVDLKNRAEAEVVDVRVVLQQIQTPEGLRAHRIRMGKLTVTIPVAYDVTYSVEDGHPCGRSRHMSMSVRKDGRVPNDQALWMVCEHLGFRGSLEGCAVWPEEIGHGMVAINVLQPLES